MLERFTFELNLKGRIGAWQARKSIADSGAGGNSGKTGNDWFCTSAHLSWDGSRIRRG